MNVLGPDGTPLTLGGTGEVLIVNETDAPDDAVQQGVATYFEQSELALSYDFNNWNFQNYANQGNGSLLARRKFETPKDVFEEICLARNLADKDDDIAATIGGMIALAFGEGFSNSHRDEVTLALYDEMAKNAKLDIKLEEMYREWLISGQLNTVTLFTREKFSFVPQGTDRFRTREVAAPLVGVLPAEKIRILGNDMFGTGKIAFLPEDASLEAWLRKRFNPNTDAATLRQMRIQDPISFALYTGMEVIPYNYPDEHLAGLTVFYLNPRMVYRSTMAKGESKYPTPPMTRNFALLEAKRLLNIMDYALLQGGANFIVIAKKGTDNLPAMPNEVQNLKEVVRRASRTGVIVGDHRLSLEVVTPDLTELLNSEKRKLLGRKLAMALLRTPEHMTDAPGGEGMKAEVEVMSRVITSDRRHIQCHVEDYVYEEAAERNPTTFAQGAAKMWFPKIILQGTQYFTDYLLKMRDRGDISRHTAVEVAGFDYDAEVQRRRREKPDDKVMTPAVVPFDSPAKPGGGGTAGPNFSPAKPSAPTDNPPGRPPGGKDRAAPKVTAEHVTAEYDEDLARVVRVGDLTREIMAEYPDLHVGRVSAIERKALTTGETSQRGPVIVVVVDTDDEMVDHQAVRLDDSTSLIVGTREYDGAKVTCAVSFKGLGWSVPETEDKVAAWGFPVSIIEPITQS